jgi:fucose permease
VVFWQSCQNDVSSGVHSGHVKHSEIQPSTINPKPLHAARVATLLIFFLNGFGVANWAVRIPALKTQLQLSEGVLGLGLLCIALGSVAFMPIVGRVIAHSGSRLAVERSVFGFAIALALLTAAPNIWMLIPAFVFFGAMNGGLDVAMNAQATTIEQRLGRPIITSFHAFWSVGSLLGAAVGGLFAGAKIVPVVHLGVVALVLGLVFALAIRPLLSGDADPNPQTASRIKPSKALVLIAVIAFCALLTEGVSADWSAVYLHETLGTDQSFAALGLVATQCSMAALRFVGDALTTRFGASSLVRLGALVTGIGMILALLIGTPWAALIGFASIGVGMSVIFPVTISAASRLPGIASGSGIAWVASFGYAGFLAAPPIIGFVAQWTSLRLGLGVVVLACLVILVLSQVVQTTPNNVQAAE